MSHFTVLVIGDNPEKQLAPYQENNMGDCPQEYMEFNDIEAEYKEKYEKEGSLEWYPKQRKEVDRAVYEHLLTLEPGQREAVNVTGMIFDKVERGDKIAVYMKRDQIKDDEEFVLAYATVASVIENQPSDKPDTCTTGKIMLEMLEAPKEIPFKEQYADFDTFMKEYAGDERNAEGKYGYWHNPNCKWDWYQLGGRWQGFFKRKDGTKTKVGNAGVFGSGRQDLSDRCDQGLKSDIDFMGMYDDAADRAHKEYDAIAALFDGNIPKLDFLWASTHVEGNPYKTKEERVKAYDAQDANVSLAALKAKYPRNSEELKTLSEPQIEFLHGFHMGPPSLESFQCTREEYAGRAVANAISTFAVVKDGKWYEKGVMGWWAMVSDEKDEKDWQEELRKLIDESSDDTLFSLYDCHI